MAAKKKNKAKSKDKKKLAKKTGKSLKKANNKKSLKAVKKKVDKKASVKKKASSTGKVKKSSQKSKLSKPSKTKKAAASKKSIKKTAIKKKADNAKKIKKTSQKVKQNKPVKSKKTSSSKKAVSKSIQKTKSPKITSSKKTAPKNAVTKVSKITKADAAKTTQSKHSEIKTKSQTEIKKSVTSTTAERTTYSSKGPEGITIERVMEETKEENSLPKVNKPSETTSFSDSLSHDITSVYSKTSEDVSEPPGKFTLEYSCRTSPELLYKFLTDPIELTEWFCDDVNIRNGIYTFVWNGVPQQARLVKQERNLSVRFQWVDKNDGSYFEFNIHKNPLTGDVILYVTDFSEPEELESNKLWWNAQINKLKNILGLQY